jgi:hypothetical protein
MERREQRKRGGERTRRQAEMGWCTMGWPASGKSGLGTLSDSGRNRVPVAPAANSERRSEGAWSGERADLVTLGGAADHDDGDDALLGAGHGSGWLAGCFLSGRGASAAAGGVAGF